MSGLAGGNKSTSVWDLATSCGHQQCDVFSVMLK